MAAPMPGLALAVPDPPAEGLQCGSFASFLYHLAVFCYKPWSSCFAYLEREQFLSSCVCHLLFALSARKMAPESGSLASVSSSISWCNEG